MWKKLSRVGSILGRIYVVEYTWWSFLYIWLTAFNLQEKFVKVSNIFVCVFQFSFQE